MTGMASLMTIFATATWTRAISSMAALSPNMYGTSSAAGPAGASSRTVRSFTSATIPCGNARLEPTGHGSDRGRTLRRSFGAGHDSPRSLYPDAFPRQPDSGVVDRSPGRQGPGDVPAAESAGHGGELSGPTHRAGQYMAVQRTARSDPDRQGPAYPAL